MPDSSKVVARQSRRSGEVVVEYQREGGRLRIIEGGKVMLEWFPPHSWFAIASAAGRAGWGTLPNEADLLRVLENVYDGTGAPS